MRRARTRFLFVTALGIACLSAVLLAQADDQPPWLQSISVAHGAERLAAIQTLSASRPDLSDDLIAELSNDHPPRVISAMAQALAGMKLSSGEITSVADLLSDENAATRFAAVLVLREHAQTAARALVGVATDVDESIPLRAAASAALAGAGSIGEGALEDLVTRDGVPPAVRQASLRALAKVSSTGAARVVKVAGDLDEPWPDRQAAVHALGSADVTLPATAGDLLQSKDARVRAQMVRALIDRGEVAELATIAKATGDTDATTRLVALQGVAHYQGLVTHRAALLLRLTDPDPRVQALAAKAVGATCSDIKTTVVPKLKRLLVSTNFRVRHDAAMALLQLRDKSGQATMLTDSASKNLSQARQAKTAYDAIRLASW